MTDKQTKEDRFKFKTWVIPLPDFHYVHQTYSESNDHRDFLGREKQVRDFVEVLRNNSSTSGSYLVTGYRGAGKTSFVKKVTDILANSYPKLESYNNIVAKFFLSIKKNLLKHSPDLYEFLQPRIITFNPTIILLLFGLLYILFIPVRLWDLLILPALFVFYYFHKYHFAVFSPRQWYRWIFKPVVQVPVNLSHDIRDPKKVIFSIISLLKDRYTQSLKSKVRTILLLIIINLSAILAIILYHLFPSFHDYLETKIHTVVFSTPHPEQGTYCTGEKISEKFMLPHVAEADKWRLNITGNQEFEAEVEQVESARSGTVSFFRELIFVPAYCAVKHFSQDIYLFSHQLGNSDYRKIEGSSDAWFGTSDERLALLLHGLDGWADLFDIKTNRQANIEEILDLDKENVPPEDLREEIQYFKQFFNNDKKLLAFLGIEPQNGKESHDKENVAKKILEKHEEHQLFVSLQKEINNNQPDYTKLVFLLEQMRTSYHNSLALLLEHVIGDEPQRLVLMIKRLTSLIDDLNRFNKTKEEKIEEKIEKLAPRPYQLIFFLLIFMVLYFFMVLLSPIRRVIRHLEEIHKRIQASDILDTSGVAGPKFPFWQKRYQHFHRLDERQAESLLLQVLEENANSFLIRPHIIFLFDELDKIHPPQEQVKTGDIEPVELGLSESIRQRQYEIEKLLGNLKNLITTAPCNFIFAAGREMMDANLADRGEIRFLHGTLFDRVYYIPSFLTDPSDGNREDISSMIEQYVCRRLMSPTIAQFSFSLLQKTTKATVSHDQHNEYPYWTLKTYMQYLKHAKVKESLRFRLLAFLQDFIYFLSYRSGGNTKKLALHFEEFLRPFPNQEYSSQSEKYHQLINTSKNPFSRIISALKAEFSAQQNEVFTHLPKTSVVLHFNEQEQYRIQLIAHLFTIFHGSYSKLVNNYGDKLSISVFSILDYVFKFHSMSFSRRDLEHMPGALDIHRAPALPQIINVLVEKILSPYTNQIDNGFYVFHFARYIQREIIYISQFSEQDMAAFNFSLDESIQIKQHYRQILNEQLKLFREKIPLESTSQEQGITGTQDIFVLPNLHMVLGDLHAQDNEFDQAMAEYFNAISHLSFVEDAVKYASDQPENKNKKKDQKVEKILVEVEKVLGAPLIFYVQIMLKLGLLQERRMIYNSAIAIYYRAMETVDHLLLKTKAGQTFLGKNIERFYILLQPYFCLAFLHAKRNSDPDNANYFMKKSLKLIQQFQGEKNHQNNNLQSKQWDDEIARFCASATSEKYRSDFPDRTGLVYKHHIRWAEMWMMRSQFKKAVCQYLCALNSLIHCNSCQESEESKTLNCYDIGTILAGMADACTALAFHSLYKSDSNDSILQYLPSKTDGNTPKDDNAPEQTKEPQISLCYYYVDYQDKQKLKKDIKKIVDWWEQLYKDVKESALSEISVDENKLKPLFKKSFFLYVLASHAYRLAGLPADEGRMLWKIAYAAAFGLSYIDITNKGDLTKDDKIDWIFSDVDEDVDEDITKTPTDQNPIRKAFSGAFGGSYAIHRKHLQDDIGIKDDHKDGHKKDSHKVLRWIAPPLTQFLMVLGNFWKAYWEKTDPPPKMDETAFEVIDMGAFPMSVRILALYLKGRWYHKHAKGKHEYKAKAFRLFVQAIEDGQAYEGGFDYIALPLGIIHYHIWEIVKENEKDSQILKEIKENEEFKEEFKGDMQRYFSPDYCRHRTEKLLTELLSRHNVPGINKERFFTYMSKHYYLYDAFADPYVNGIWALEYGLVPVAEFMLKKMNGSSDVNY